MADQEKEILEEEMEQDLSDAEELKEEETEREEPETKADKKGSKEAGKAEQKGRFLQGEDRSAGRQSKASDGRVRELPQENR